MNTYAYVGGNPLSYIDPLGESAAAAVGGWITGDTVVPDPTDLAWPKWVGYGIALGGAGLFDWIIYNNESDESGSGTTPEECPYPDNPDSSPDNFSPVKGRKGKQNNNDGSVWERDHSRHGGDQWKRWKDRRNYDNNPRNPDNSIWPDGRVRK